MRERPRLSRARITVSTSRACTAGLVAKVHRGRVGTRRVVVGVYVASLIVSVENRLPP